MLTQNKNTSTWPAKKSLAMCKTEHYTNTQLMTHKPRLHTNHVKHKSMQPVKKKTCCMQHSTGQKHSMQLIKQAVCNKTRVRKAEHGRTRTVSKTKHKTCGQRSTWPERTRDCRLPQQERTWSMSVRTPAWNQNLNKTRVPGSEAPSWNKAHRREIVCSQENKTRGECQVSVTKPCIN